MNFMLNTLYIGAYQYLEYALLIFNLKCPIDNIVRWNKYVAFYFKHLCETNKWFQISKISERFI